jgi:hypothetical protein
LHSVADVPMPPGLSVSSMNEPVASANSEAEVRGLPQCGGDFAVQAPVTAVWFVVAFVWWPVRSERRGASPD